MKQTSTTSRTPINEVCSVGGRVLILFTALLLAVTPWTEYLWHFDNFLHGGQDMELGLLSLVTIFCLVLVLLQDSKQRVTSMVVIRQWLSSVLDQADPLAPGSFHGLNIALNATPPNGFSLGTYTPPFKSDPPPRNKPENDSFESFTNSVTDQLHLCFARGEVMQEVVVVSGLKVAIKPPDEDNQYGYRKAKPTSGHRLCCFVILTLSRHRSMSSVRLVLLGALLLPAMLRAQANLPDVPEANPARPTISTPAALTPVGYLQFEDGGLYATDSPEFSKRLGINQVYKLTLDKRVELLTLFEPFTHSTGAAVSGNRPGEIFAGVQAVILPGKGERPAISGQYLRRLYASPAPELDLGTFVQSMTILLSDDLGGFHFDVNGLMTEQQDDKTKARRAQFAQTLSISHPVGKVAVSAELWHFAQPLTHGYAVGNLFSASYPVRKNVVIDAGFDHGLTSTSTHWESFIGFTYLLPHRLWRQGR